MARPICVIGSGGVKIAATEKIITTTYLLVLLRYFEFTTPIFANKFNNIGSWKLTPKAKINLIINDKYSFTLASNWIGKELFDPIDSKDRKNFIARGIIR